MMQKRQLKKTAAKKEISESKFACFLLIPAVILIIGVVLYPFVYTVYITFFQSGLLNSGTGFLGLSQYLRVLTDSNFWSSLAVTVYFTVVSLFVQTILGLSMALLLNLEFKGRSLMRGLILAPWAVPTIVNAQLWSWIYQASYGVLNKLLLKLGLIHTPVIWLGTAFSAINCVIFADTWKMAPLYAIMFLAGMQTISPDLREAAMIDGAGALKRLRYIILPLLSPIIMVVLILRTMQALRVFDIVYVLTKGGPNNGTMVVSYYAYFKTFKTLDFSYGATIGLLVAVITVFVSLLYKKILQRNNAY